MNVGIVTEMLTAREHCEFLDIKQNEEWNISHNRNSQTNYRPLTLCTSSLLDGECYSNPSRRILKRQRLTFPTDMMIMGNGSDSGMCEIRWH